MDETDAEKKTAKKPATAKKPTAPKKPRHRPRAIVGKPSPTHKPTPELRTKVSNWAEVGTSHDVIALELGIHKETLYKYYRQELDDAPQRGVAKVANALYEKAIKGDTVSMIFYLKTRGKWREKHDDEKPVKGEGVDVREIVYELLRRKLLG